MVASTALLWFDFALTFTAEVEQIWMRKFTGATIVYLLMRYSALIHRVFFMLEVFVWNSSDRVGDSSPDIVSTCAHAHTSPALRQTCGGIIYSGDILIILHILGFACADFLHFVCT